MGYSDGTPAVSFTYTGARLTSVSDGSGSESYAYDGLGRISNLAKVIDATTYNIGYSYNLASELTSLTYPSGRVVNQSYDAVGRLTQIADNVSYLSGMSYNSASLPTGFSYGNGVAASFGYNTRLELASLSYVKGANTLLSLSYAYGTSNNGQIATITDNQNASNSMTYSYDALARLQYATAGPTGSPTWKLGFVYDRYGNRTQQNLLAGTGFATQTPTDPVTNRLTSPNVNDASGNLTNDTTHTYTYDAENRIKQVDGGATATYTYDGGPLRVKEVVTGATVVRIYSGSKLIAYYVNGALAGEYVYAGGTLLAGLDSNGTRIYHHPDHLTQRVLTNQGGGVEWTGGHYPFGESWYQPTGNDSWRFTTYERKSESQLDYAIFRDYSTRLGRFAQPDPLAGSVGSPQSLNRYAYVRNDPVNAVDPFGLWISWDDLMDITKNGWKTVFPGELEYCNLESDYEVYSEYGGGETADFVTRPICHKQHFGLLGGRRGGGKKASKKNEERECFAQLKYRPVDDPRASIVGATHSFWYVQGSTGTQFIVSAGPNPPSGSNQTLNVGTNTNIHGGADNVSATTAWNSGLSFKNCKGVDALLAAANAFPNNTIPYSPTGPNSNSAANYLGQQGGFNPDAPPGSWGWDVPVTPGPR